MKLNIYAVYDRKAGAHLRPFFEHNDSIAVRSFTWAVRDRDSSFSRFPEDFALYRIGSFEDDSGIVAACDLEFVCQAVSLIEPSDEPDFVSLLEGGENGAAAKR